jgi:hypothetical protein
MFFPRGGGDQVLYPYKTTVVFLMITFLARRQEDRIFSNEWWQAVPEFKG